MPVQKKSNTVAPGEKQKKSWIQIAAIAFIVIVVVMCVLSFSNFSSLFSNSGTQGVNGGVIAEGDPVAVYFSTNIGNTTTFSYDPEDYTTEIINTYTPYRVVADTNSSIVDNDYTSILLSAGNASFPYGIYAEERNAMAKALVGKQYGERIRVSSPYMALATCTAEDIKGMGLDINEIKVGDIMPMTLAYTDVLGNQEAYLRYGVVYSINDDLSGLTLNCGSDTIDIIAIGKYSS